MTNGPWSTEPISVDLRVLKRAIGSTYLLDRAADPSVTGDKAEAFADRVIESIGAYERVIAEEDAEEGRPVPPASV